MTELNSPENVKEVAANIGKNARLAFKKLALSSPTQRDMALKNMAKQVLIAKNEIIEANKLDVINAQNDGLNAAMIDRLLLDDVRINAIANGLISISEQKDSIFEIMETFERPNGLKIDKVRIPIGIIGIIYESRPNVTADAGGLCLRSGNCVILRGGKEAINSSKAIANALRLGLEEAGLPKDCIQFIPSTNRDYVGEMLRGFNGTIDMIIPRGGKTLVARVQEEAKVPVLSHLDGICHTYIEKSADFEKAFNITMNAKMRRTGICGATETLLIDKNIADKILPQIANALVEKNCELRGCENAIAIFSMNEAIEEDWSTEYLAPILSIKIVENINEAIEHIEKYGSHHTDAIITEDIDAANEFINRVDSSIVIHNASTQFADGGEFGFGGEIGIGTGRLHARGPVGALGLTTYKYAVHGQGQTRP